MQNQEEEFDKLTTTPRRKKMKRKDNEDKNQYARWMTACKSPMTYDSWEYGDAYISEIMSVKPKLLSATDDWKATYENKNR